MLRTLIALSSATLLASLLSGCPATSCADGEQQCSGDMIQTCVDGSWGAAAECETAGEACMTMDSGLQHCMEAMADDDDSGMSM